MSSTVITFLLGNFFGLIFGVFIVALATAASKNDEDKRNGR